MTEQPDPIPSEGLSPLSTVGFLTVKQAAGRIGLSVETVRAMCNDGSLSGAERKRGRWYIPSYTAEAWRSRQSEVSSNGESSMAPTGKVVSVPPSREPGPPARWQRFRNNPWVFYPVTFISVLSFLVCLVFGLISAGADFGGFSRQVKEWGLVREFPAERDGETLIVIAQFQHSEGIADTEAHNEVRKAIVAAAQELGESTLRVVVSSVPIATDDQDRARKLGQKYRASIIIWGADTGTRVAVNFLNLKHPDFVASQTQISETERTQIANPSAYAPFITGELPGQLTFLSLFAVGQSYYARGEYGSSIKAIRKAVASLTEEPATLTGLVEAHFFLGYLLQSQGRNQESIDEYSKVVALEPTHVAAYSNRGIALSARGDLQGSLADYNTAIELDPAFAPPYNNRGGERYEQGDLSGARSDFDSAIALRPDYAEAYANRGNVGAKQGDLKGAIADYSEAIRLKPDYAKAHSSRSLARSGQGDQEGAIADCDKAISLESNDAYVYVTCGIVRLKLGDATSAIVDFNQAIILRPDFAEAHYNRGMSRSKQGDVIGAIADYNAAIVLRPGYADVYVNRGIMRGTSGDFHGALADFRRFLELSPDGPRRQQVEEWISAAELQLSNP